MFCVVTVLPAKSFTVGSSKVARHRRPPVEGPPIELLTFRGDDWISDDGVPPLERWHYARFVWARDHPDDYRLGGDVLDMLREHVAYKRGLTVGF
jgi:hypothetical protein